MASAMACSIPYPNARATPLSNSRTSEPADLSQQLKALKLSSSCSGFNGRIRIQGTPAVRIQSKFLEVSALGKRAEQLEEIRKMSDEDIGLSVVDLKGELFILRCKQATRQEYKSSEFRKIRKQIARMLTVRRERELENGITKRESRKLDREWKKNIVIKPPASLATLQARKSS